MLKLRSNCLILYGDKSSETPLVEEDMQYLQRPATVNSSLYRTRTAAAAESRPHGGCYNRRLSGLMGDVTKIYFQAQLFNSLFCRVIYLTIFQIVTDSNGGSSRVQTECGWRNRRLATFEKQSLKSLLSKAQNLNCCVIAKQSPATKRLCRGATSCRVLFWA